jgi:hypothetical protein
LVPSRIFLHFFFRKKMDLLLTWFITAAGGGLDQERYSSEKPDNTNSRKNKNTEPVFACSVVVNGLSHAVRPALQRSRSEAERQAEAQVGQKKGLLPEPPTPPPRFRCPMSKSIGIDWARPDNRTWRANWIAQEQHKK